MLKFRYSGGMFSLVSEIRDRISNGFGPFIGFIIALYFVVHFIQGDRGILSYLRLKTEVVKAETAYEDIHAKRLELDKKVSLLRPDRMDPDMADERAREMLGYIGEDEIILVLPAAPAVQP